MFVCGRLPDLNTSRAAAYYPRAEHDYLLDRLAHTVRNVEFLNLLAALEDPDTHDAARSLTAPGGENSVLPCTCSGDGSWCLRP